MEITAFHDVETPQISALPMAQNVSNAQDMDDTHSIVQFLQRPVKLDTFQIQPGDSTKRLKPVVFDMSNAQEPLRSYSLPRDVMLKGNKLEKMINHQYFKADVHVKVVLNANPFISGRFYLTYSPYEEQVSSSRKQVAASRAGVTAYPGVEIDAQLDNSVEMVIPFASYKEAYVLTSEEPEDFVKLHLFCISPVQSGASTVNAVVDFSIYAWFENIVINIPTCKTLPLLDAKYSKENKVIEYRTRNVEVKDPITRQIEQLALSDPQAYERILQLIQRRTAKMASPSWHVNASMQIQVEAQEKGPIETLFTGIGDVAGKLEGLPVVGEVAGPIKWVADFASGVASIFGWSRPTSMQAITDFHNVPGKNYSHVTAIDNSVNLSLSNQNELGPPEQIFPSAEDEMSLAYVCANPAVKYIFQWTVGENQQTKHNTLGVIPVGIGPFDRYTGKTGQVFDTGYIWPWQYEDCSKHTGSWPIYDGKSTEPAAGGANLALRYRVAPSILDTAPCEYVSQMFSYWRATMCYKISVVKTAFHTGRLEIFFDPGPYQLKNSQIDYSYYDNVDTSNNYKYILDLTNDTEITIKVPYVSDQVFKSTLASNTYVDNPLSGSYSQADIFDSMIGSLIIRPVSKLLAPETVADNIEVVVWKWAEDVVLSIPKPATQSEFHIYQPPAKPPTGSKLNISAEQLDAYFRGPDASSICYMKDKVPFSCTETPEWIKASMQINISNKADGNVEVFFQTGNIADNDMTACINAMGERIANLRPLLRAFRRIGKVQTQPNLPISFDFQRNLVRTSPNPAYDDTVLQDVSPDYASILSYMYRFFRGGNRLKFFTEAIGKATRYDSLDTVSKIVSNITNLGKDNRPHIGPTHTTFTDLNPIHEITIPFYSKFRKLPISVSDNIFTPQVQTSVPTELSVYRAGNDDLTYGWLMGTPQLSLGVGVVDFVSWHADKYQQGEICTPSAIANTQRRYKAEMQIDVPDRLGATILKEEENLQLDKQTTLKLRTMELLGRFMNEHPLLDWDCKLVAIRAMAEFHRAAWDKGSAGFEPNQLRDWMMQGHAWIWDGWDSELTPAQRCQAIEVFAILYESFRAANA